MANLKCPKCQGKTQILDTRSRADGKIKRRRQCFSCKYRFNTFETLDKKR
ncbi:MAG: hypothetical protein QNJ37_04735 [Crocosphaera sp.]|nr:hypothetical protein [Crocosphaera sp.]